MDALKKLIRTIPDFPEKGIQFRDLTTLFLDPGGFRQSVSAMAAQYRGKDIDAVVGIESRGFIIAAPLAVEMGKGFVPVRKPGKLPGETFGVEYTLEYGEGRLEIHTDALAMGSRVLMVDDLLATGGTMEAACKLMEHIGCEVVGCAFLVELVDLKGRNRIQRYPITNLVEFQGE